MSAPLSLPVPGPMATLGRHAMLELFGCDPAASDDPLPSGWETIAAVVRTA